MNNSLRTACVASSMLLAALLAGCASAPPAPTHLKAEVPGTRVTSVDTVQVVVNAPDAVKATADEKARLADKIKSRINATKGSVPGTGAPRSYSVELVLSRYEKGSAFARFMLAGLGQIHIDGKVTIFGMPEHQSLVSFDMSKTFAWGGAYGGSTTIDTIEDTYADGVAAQVTGQAEKPVAKK
jgi:hypothetical protein